MAHLPEDDLIQRRFRISATLCIPGMPGILWDAHGDTRTYRYLGNNFDYLNTGPTYDSGKGKHCVV